MDMNAQKMFRRLHAKLTFFMGIGSLEEGSFLFYILFCLFFVVFKKINDRLWKKCTMFLKFICGFLYLYAPILNPTFKIIVLFLKKQAKKAKILIPPLKKTENFL